MNEKDENRSLWKKIKEWFLLTEEDKEKIRKEDEISRRISDDLWV